MKYFQDEMRAQPIQLQNANAFCQDNNGNLLIGSDGCLFVYRSQQELFSKVVCSFTDQPQMKAITSLTVYDDKLWMGTQQGLYYATISDSLTFRPLACPNAEGALPLQISCLLVGPGNHLWVSSQHHGLFMLKKDGDSKR